MSTRALLAGIVVAGALGCGTEPGLQRTEAWAADLRTTQQVLLMSLRYDATSVTGSGTLSDLTNVESHQLSIAGQASGDSLRLTFARQGFPTFRFIGSYRPQGLAGYLLDAEFDSVAVLFRPL